MEKSIEDIEAEIASLKEHAREYRRVAAEHRAGDSPLVADKMAEAADECDAKVVELEELLGEARK
jgi:hypothetical protein